MPNYLEDEDEYGLPKIPDISAGVEPPAPDSDDYFSPDKVSSRDDDIKQATSTANDRSLAAGLGRAAATFMGGKDMGYYDQLDKRAQSDLESQKAAQQEQLKDYLLKKKLGRQSVLDERTDTEYNKKASPDSPLNTAGRARYSETLTKFGVPPELQSQLTNDDIRALIGGDSSAVQRMINTTGINPTTGKRTRYQVPEGAGLNEAVWLAEEPFANTGSDSGVVFDKATSSWMYNGQEISASQAAQLERQHQQLMSQSGALGSKLGASAGEAVVDLKEAKAALQFTRDKFTPEMHALFTAAHNQGWAGPIAGRAGELGRMLGVQFDGNAETLRLAIKDRVVEHVKHISGAAVTDAERANLEKLFANPNMTPALFITTMNELVRRAERRVTMAELLLQQYPSLTPQEAMNRAVFEEQSGEKTQPDPADQSVITTPPPAKYLYSPSRNKTKVVYPDGTEEILDGKQGPK